MTRLSLDDRIRLYAEAAAEDLTDASDESFHRRVELHDALCDALGVKRDVFKPFEYAEGISFMNPAMAERMIRMEIRRVKHEV